MYFACDQQTTKAGFFGAKHIRVKALTRQRGRYNTAKVNTVTTVFLCAGKMAVSVW